MKKFLVMLLALVMSVTTLACRSEKNPNDPDATKQIENLNIQDKGQTTEYPNDFTGGWGLGNGTVKQGMTYRPYIVTEDSTLEAVFVVSGPDGKRVNMFNDCFFVASETGAYTVTAMVGEDSKTATVTCSAATEDYVFHDFENPESVRLVGDVFGYGRDNTSVYKYEHNTDPKYVTEGTGSLKVTSTADDFDAIDEPYWPSLGFFGRPGDSLTLDEDKTAYDTDGRPLIGLVDWNSYTALSMDVIMPAGSFSNYFVLPFYNATGGRDLSYVFYPIADDVLRVTVPVPQIETSRDNIFSFGVCTDKVKKGDTIYFDNIRLIKGDPSKTLITTFNGKNEFVKIAGSDNVTASYSHETQHVDGTAKLTFGAGQSQVILYTSNGAMEVYGAIPSTNKRAIMLRDLTKYKQLTLKVKSNKTVTIRQGMTAGASLDERTGQYSPAIAYDDEVVLPAGEWVDVTYDLATAIAAGIDLTHLDKNNYKGHGFWRFELDAPDGLEWLVKDFYAVY